MATATLREIVIGDGINNGIYLLICRCDRCGKQVAHGGGRAPDQPDLGWRVTHCRCAGQYEIVDPLGVATEVAA